MGRPTTNIFTGYGKIGILGPDVLHEAFFPFLQTTARSEGFNVVLKKYVNPNNSLIEFATQYTAIQEKVMVAVAKEQVDTIYKEADMYSLNPIELQM